MGIWIVEELEECVGIINFARIVIVNFHLFIQPSIYQHTHLSIFLDTWRFFIFKFTATSQSIICQELVISLNSTDSVPFICLSFQTNNSNLSRYSIPSVNRLVIRRDYFCIQIHTRIHGWLAHIAIQNVLSRRQLLFANNSIRLISMSLEAGSNERETYSIFPTQLLSLIPNVRSLANGKINWMENESSV